MLRRACPIVRVLAVLVAAGLAGGAARAQSATEYQVKAAYLYNFGKYVKWPAETPEQKTQFAICVLGEDPFGEVLDQTLRGRSLQERKLVVKRVRSSREAASCRIVFVAASEAERLGEIVPTLSRAGVLTVSDIDGFTDRAGMIALVFDGNRVRFEINLAAVEAAGLSMSSQLLKLARNVVGQARPGE